MDEPDDRRAFAELMNHVARELVERELLPSQQAVDITFAVLQELYIIQILTQGAWQSLVRCRLGRVLIYCHDLNENSFLPLMSSIRTVRLSHHFFAGLKNAIIARMGGPRLTAPIRKLRYFDLPYQWSNMVRAKVAALFIIAQAAAPHDFMGR
jgi:hypothetical protein